MALSLNPSTKVITIPQADLTPEGGTLYSMDTNAFRLAVGVLLASEAYVWMPYAFQHNTEVTVAGTTYARTLEFINGYKVEFEDGQYSVRLEGSNNNIWEIPLVLVQNQVQVIPTNAAGLIVVQSGDNVDTDKVIGVVEDWGVINFAG